MEQEGSGQEKPQWLMYRHSCRPFETCPSDMFVSKMNLFSDKITTSNLGNTSSARFLGFRSYWTLG